MRYGRREPRGGDATSYEEMVSAAEVVERALPEAPAGVSAREFVDGLDLVAAAREALVARVEISSADSADRVAARDLAGIAHVDEKPAPEHRGRQRRPGEGAGRGARTGRQAPLPGRARGMVGGRERTGGAPGRGRGGAPRRRLRGGGAGPRAVTDRLRPTAARRTRRGIVRRPLRPRGQAVRAAGRACASRRRDVRARALLVLDGHRRQRGGAARGERVRRLVRGARSARRGRRAERWLASLARLRGDLALDPAGALLSTWSGDPWAGAAYSSSPPLELARIASEPRRTARVRRRASRRRVRRADGGRDPQRPRSGRGRLDAPQR